MWSKPNVNSLYGIVCQSVVGTSTSPMNLLDGVEYELVPANSVKMTRNSDSDVILWDDLISPFFGPKYFTVHLFLLSVYKAVFAEYTYWCSFRQAEVISSTPKIGRMYFRIEGLALIIRRMWLSEWPQKRCLQLDISLLYKKDVIVDRKGIIRS